MNTSDIRDMEANQQLFWSIAAPVTAFVLTAALLYGYKGEEIADVFARWLRTRVRQDDKASVITRPSRQSTWLSAKSKDDVPERTEQRRSRGGLRQHLMRHRQSKGDGVVEANV